MSSPWFLPLRPWSQGRFSLVSHHLLQIHHLSLGSRAAGQGGVPRKEGEGRAEITDVRRGGSRNQALGFGEKDVLSFLA